MERITKNIDGVNFDFVCKVWEKRNSWGHESTLFIDGSTYSANTTKVRYYNRTWESYQFQSCLIQNVMEMIQFQQNYLVNEWKTINNKKRITKEQKESLFSQSIELQRYNKLLESLRSR